MQLEVVWILRLRLFANELSRVVSSRGKYLVDNFRPIDSSALLLASFHPKDSISLLKFKDRCDCWVCEMFEERLRGIVKSSLSVGEQDCGMQIDERVRAVESDWCIAVAG